MSKSYATTGNGAELINFQRFRREVAISKHSFWSKIDSFALNVTKMAFGQTLVEGSWIVPNAQN